MSGEQSRVLLSRSTLYYSYSVPMSTVNPLFSLHNFSGLCISGEQQDLHSVCAMGLQACKNGHCWRSLYANSPPSSKYSKNFPKSLKRGIASRTAFDSSCSLSRGRKGNEKALLGLFSYVGCSCGHDGRKAQIAHRSVASYGKCLRGEASFGRSNITVCALCHIAGCACCCGSCPRLR